MYYNPWAQGGYQQQYQQNQPYMPMQSSWGMSQTTQSPWGMGGFSGSSYPSYTPQIQTGWWGGNNPNQYEGYSVTPGGVQTDKGVVDPTKWANQQNFLQRRQALQDYAGQQGGNVSVQQGTGLMWNPGGDRAPISYQDMASQGMINPINVEAPQYQRPDYAFTPWGVMTQQGMMDPSQWANRSTYMQRRNAMNDYNQANDTNLNYQQLVSQGLIDRIAPTQAPQMNPLYNFWGGMGQMYGGPRYW